MQPKDLALNSQQPGPTSYLNDEPTVAQPNLPSSYQELTVA